MRRRVSRGRGSARRSRVDSVDGMTDTVRRRTGPAGRVLRMASGRAPVRHLILTGSAACRRTDYSLGVPDGRSLTLTASLRPAALDARRGIVRLHPEVFTALGLRPGDPVRLTGRRETAGIVALAQDG